MYSPARPSPCASHASTAQGEFPPPWGWQGELAGSQGWCEDWLRSVAAGEAQLSFYQALSAGVLASITPPCCPSRSQAHLILLGELQPIVGLEPVNVVSEVGQRDGGVVTHACRRDEEGEENGYGSAWPRKAQQEHVHSKPRRWAQGGHCDYVKCRAGWMGS